jgi:uncharacterized damage-inducible protein DinB
MSYPANEYKQAFLSHREPLLELLGQIPNTQSDFSIYKGGLTIKQHIDQLFGFDAEVLGALTGQRPDTTASPDLASAVMRLRQHTASIASSFAAMSSEQLDASLELEGETRKVYQWLDFVREHEIHHKGQLWMAARLLEIEPPYYVKL